MSKADSGLGGVSSKGFVDVAEVGLRGMITLRGFPYMPKPVRQSL